MRVTEKKYGILAWPAYTNKNSNPYNYLIYNNIEQKGYKIIEFDFNIKNILKYVFSSDFKIFHIHWPTNILTYSTYLQARRRILMFKYFLILIRLLGKKVVWTVHNLNDHEKNHPELQKKLNNLLYKYVDGFISLNKNGLIQVESRATGRKKQQFKYIPHPHYKDYYENYIGKEKARDILGISKDKFVFLFIGQIRRYKNIIGLIDAFKQLKFDNKFLLIAGNVHHEIKEEIYLKLKTTQNVIFNNSFVKDSDLQLYLNSSDLVVTPYSDIFNSGSVFLNMSFNKPTLAPEIGIFPELKAQTGEFLIKLYKGNLSENDLEKAMLHVMEENPIEETDLSMFDLQIVAAETTAFYNTILGY